MQKKLELKGQMTTIVKYVNASKELVECATRVPTAVPRREIERWPTAPSSTSAVYQPTRVVFGDGAVTELGARVQAARHRARADRHRPRAARAHRRGGARGGGARRAAGRRSTTASSPTPASRSSTTARAFAREHGCDGLVSVGGGSAIDTAKGMAIVLTEGGSIRDHQGASRLHAPADAAHRGADDGGHRQRGLASTSSSRIERAHEKMHFIDDRIIPDAAILDPSVTLDMPAHADRGDRAWTRSPTPSRPTPRSTATRSPTGWRCRRSASSRATCRARSTERRRQGGARTDAARGQHRRHRLQLDGRGPGARHGARRRRAPRRAPRHGQRHLPAARHPLQRRRAGRRYRDVAEALGIDARDLGDEMAGEAAAQAVAQLATRIKLPARLRDVGVPEGRPRRAAPRARSPTAPSSTTASSPPTRSSCSASTATRTELRRRPWTS